MGLELAARAPSASALLDAATGACGEDVRRLLAGGGRGWQRTEVLQPLIVAVCLGVTAELRSAGLRPRAVAGHSLGELSAWSAAGCIPLAQAVELAALRGRLMARAAAHTPGGMLALIDCDEAGMQATLDAAGRPADVSIAGCNAPRQWVLSGSRASLRKVAALAPSRWLSAAGPWHHSAMSSARVELRAALRRVQRADAEALLVSAATGQVAEPPDSIPDRLADQLVLPFRWDRVMSTLRKLGIERFVTVGPGKVLRALVRDNLGPEATVLSTESPTDLDRTIAQVLA